MIETIILDEFSSGVIVGMVIMWIVMSILILMVSLLQEYSEYMRNEEEEQDNADLLLSGTH